MAARAGPGAVVVVLGLFHGAPAWADRPASASLAAWVWSFGVPPPAIPPLPADLREECWLHAPPGEPDPACELFLDAATEGRDAAGEGLRTRAVLIRERAGARRRGIAIEWSVSSVDIIGAGRSGPAGADLGWVSGWTVLHARTPGSIDRDALWLASADTARASVRGGVLIAVSGEEAETVDLCGSRCRGGFYLVLALGDPARRFVALDLLERLDVAPVKHSLLPRLADADELVRLGVAEALASSKVNEASGVLAGWLARGRSDVSPFVRAQIVRALGRLGAPSAVPALAGVLDDPASEVREAAVAALGRIGGPPSGPPVAACAGDPDASVRRAVAAALGEVGGPTAPTALRALLADADQPTRLAAVESATKLELRALLPALIERLHDPNGEVQYAAVQAVDKLRAVAAVPHLVSLLTAGQARRSRPHALCFSPSIWLPLDCAAADALAHLGDAAGLAEARKRAPHCLEDAPHN